MLTETERRLCTRLHGGADETLTPAIAEAARRHRVHILVADRLTDRERATPEGSRLARESTMAAALDAWREETLRALLAALNEARIDALILKGTALACTVYAAPHLRPRLDVDLLIRRESLDRVERVLASLGWSRPIERDAELAEPQRHYVRSGEGGRLDHLDVHWKIAIPRLFADAVSFDELQASARPVARLGPHAWMPSYSDSLFLACVHRVAHHADAIDLLWLWDVHLLVERLTAGERTAFARRADLASMCAVCRRGVELAVELFGTRGGPETLDALAQECSGAAEPSSRFIGGLRPFDVLVSDLQALGWPDRLRLIAEHLFPSSDYMRARYPRWPRAALPLAYVDRIARGAPKWLARGRSG